MLSPEMGDELERIAADRVSGATSLVLRAIVVPSSSDRGGTVRSDRYGAAIILDQPYELSLFLIAVPMFVRC